MHIRINAVAGKADHAILHSPVLPPVFAVVVGVEEKPKGELAADGS